MDAAPGSNREPQTWSKAQKRQRSIEGARGAHPTVEDAQPSQLGPAVDGVQAGGLDVSKDEVEALPGDVSRIGSQETKSKESRNRSGLKHRLKAARVRNVDGKFFIPVDRLHKLITRESVTEELKHVVKVFGTSVQFNRSIKQIAHDVCPVDDDRIVHVWGDRKTTGHMSRRKIFAILVSMDMSARIEVFLDDGLSDTDLPLTFTRHRGATQVASAAGSKSKRLSGLLATHDEQSVLLRSFIELQQEFAAPFLVHISGGLLIENLQFNPPREIILPRRLSNWFPRAWVMQEVFVNKTDHGLGLSNQNSISTASALNVIASVLEHVYHLESRGSGKLLSTNEQKGSFCVKLPLHKGGTLGDRWYSNRQSLPISSALTDLIVKQLLGFSSDGWDYGDGNEFEKHGDIKPETRLWLSLPGDGNVVHNEYSQGTAEIADLAMSVMRKSSNATGIGTKALTCRPEEILVTEASQTYDSAWRAYAEVLTWGFSRRDLVYGMISDPHDAQSGSFFDGGSFTLEKGIRALEPSVSDWMDFTHKNKKSSPWMRDLLDVMRASVLEANPETRMNSGQLVQLFEEMQDWGKSHPRYFLPGAADDERMIFFASLPEHNTQQSAPAASGIQTRKITGRGERMRALENITEAAPMTIQLNGMKLVPCSQVDRQMSILDKLRVAVEDYLDETVDWWPLRPVARPQKAQHTELRWEYGGEVMSIILNQSETERLSMKQTQAQGKTYSIGILPTTRPRSFSSSDDQVVLKNTARNPFWKTWIQYISQLLNTSKPNTPGPGTPPGDKQMETYLCVDKCWTTIKDTRMRTVTALENMQSDFEFFCRARDLLSQAEGNWLQRKLSWRSYTSVTLSKFYFLWDDSDEVEVDVKPLPRNKKLFQGYRYTPIQDVSIEDHMRVCAKILLRGIANPELGRDGRKLLDCMPKLLAPPGLNKKQFSCGLGFHAAQGLCMRKTMGWIGAVLAFGIAFVPYWLCAIDELDVQTALAPASFLATVLGVGLAMLAIAQTR